MRGFIEVFVLVRRVHGYVFLCVGLVVEVIFLFVELFRKQLERHATLIERGNIEIVRKAEN